MQKPSVVIDNDAGNCEPQYIVPTVVASRALKGGQEATIDGVDDLDFYIGNEALAHSTTHQINYPIRHGMVENWDNMERLWQRCMFKYLRCEPEEHHVLLTEPPLNTPENRELTAEIMFETFNVPGLYIAVQAVLALAASWTKKNVKERTLTGTVIDSGDGVTHVIPVAEGYVIGSCIKHIPLAGRDITAFVHKLLRERSEPIPSEDSLEVAKRVKEMHSYVCPDLAKEFAKYDADPAKYFRTYEGAKKQTGAKWSCDVGYERLGPEIFFNPRSSPRTSSRPPRRRRRGHHQVPHRHAPRPLQEHRALRRLDHVQGFRPPLQRDIKKHADKRLDLNIQRLGALGSTSAPQKIDVNVISHQMQRFAVWFGARCSLTGEPSAPATPRPVRRGGPRIARHNAVFGTGM
ncbi:hypothetical protein JL722_14575 [Aureococcus anophagefferens]|nr:hypothetical protein JL722_14575 [Aureococcus anophagefferens]